MKRPQHNNKKKLFFFFLLLLLILLNFTFEYIHINTRTHYSLSIDDAEIESHSLCEYAHYTHTHETIGDCMLYCSRSKDTFYLRFRADLFIEVRSLKKKLELFLHPTFEIKFSFKTVEERREL